MQQPDNFFYVVIAADDSGCVPAPNLRLKPTRLAPVGQLLAAQTKQPAPGRPFR
jgi:hypothetical protein